MRALGKTPNDPLIQKMSPAQWHTCILNVIEDEKESNEKTRTILDFFGKMLCGEPKKEEDVEVPEITNYSKEAQLGEEPTLQNPDITMKYQDGTRNVEIRKVVSTEFDKMMRNPEKYRPSLEKDK